MSENYNCRGQYCMCFFIVEDNIIFVFLIVETSTVIKVTVNEVNSYYRKLNNKNNFCCRKNKLLEIKIR